MKRTLALVAVLLAVGSALQGLNVTVSQIDPSRLLVSQTVEAYVSVTDEAGSPVEGLDLAPRVHG